GKLPLMVLLLITTTTILMFLAFGSLVLPIKAALMSALTLGSTMGVLTWMFVDGHGSGLMNYTPQPLMAPMIGLIIAVIYGLSTDYEVFLVSRMVEARERGMSTTEAIRIGTATTGRLITAAALVLAVVAGAFVFSDLVMMKYLAFGLLIALLLDATIVRMFLVPAIMKLLGDDCWWAPRWMKRLQNKLGLGEIHLPDERKRPAVREPDEALVGAGAPGRRPVHDPSHPGGEARPRPRTVGRTAPPAPQEPPSAAGTARMPDPTTPDPQLAAGGQERNDPGLAAGGQERSDPGLAAGGQERSDPGLAEAPTTRFAVARNAVKNAVNNAAAAAQRRVEPTPPQPDREIESWLGELRGKPAASPDTPAPASEPTAEDATTAIPTQAEPVAAEGETAQISAEQTRAIPVSRPEPADNEVATEKLNARGKNAGDDRRRGGGVSAQDLLRREGRL
ncbi:MAG: MMPL family transporter, partial [Mycobacterium sp.]|nr:MMPL family transporter [Mycobacterium sp.]